MVPLTLLMLVWFCDVRFIFSVPSLMSSGEESILNLLLLQMYCKLLCRQQCAAAGAVRGWWRHCNGTSSARRTVSVAIPITSDNWALEAWSRRTAWQQDKEITIPSARSLPARGHFHYVVRVDLRIIVDGINLWPLNRAAWVCLK